MRVLVTGGFGFVGRHLAQHLVKSGDDVGLTYFKEESKDPIVDKLCPLPKAVQTLALDIRDGKACKELMMVLRPDAIYHLAGVPTVHDASGDDFQRVNETNVQGTINMLEALKHHSPATRFLFVSSSEVYGEPRPGTLPLTELATMRPVNSYGLSKAWADVATFTYSMRDSLDTVRIRPFPHIGPGQTDRFSISSFARQVAQIKLGKKKAVIEVGNLEAKRDFSDVSDIVRGYREIMLNGKKHDVYNLCSGKSIGVGEVLQKLIKIAEVEVEIQVDQARLRPIDISDHYGSYDKAQKDVGWKPRIDFEATLHSLFAYWLEYEGMLK
ncbi:SDR family NAD(P)-dependent oxidoreductase [bacterium]|nr:SDR family NAD(P)-dependent oxidoreductase [bacterium]